MVCFFMLGIDERVRCYLMQPMIDPSRFAEDLETNPTFPKQHRPKTDTEAIEDWEDEGGASSHSPESIVIGDSCQVPGNRVKEVSKCI